MKELDKEKIFWIGNVFILFLYAVDLFGFRNKLAIVWIVLAGLYCVVMKTAVKLDIKAVILTVGMFAHAAIFKHYYPEWSITLILSMAVVPALFYLLGRQLIGKVSKDNPFETKAEIIAVAVTIGMFIHALLNFYAWTQGHNGKYWDDFWPDVLCQITTEHSFLAVTIAALIAYGIYYTTKKWYYGVAILACALTANVINILYDNRLVLVLTAIVLCMNVVICIYLNRTSKKVIYFCIGAVLALLLCIALVVGLNVGGIKETPYFIRLTARDGGILHNIRFAGHAKAASQLFSHWKGGGTMDLLGLHHAHNYWLEMANQTGLASFIPVVAFTLGAFYDTVRVVLNKNVSHKIKYLLPSVLMGIALYLYVELGGVDRPDYFLYFTLMAGIICQFRKCAESQESSVS
ncbi:MAG: hypothetical protein HFJ10_02705 [Lachnospiraceae bacterium]|jgi:hypothetical protein|nr:hypothetical protein [Lachnospiraceae bacterium]